MSLLKILAYSLFGYVLYELYLGISAGVEAKKEEAAAPAPPAAPEQQGNANPAPSPSPAKRMRGSKTISVEGGSGSRTKRTVGRGVI